ncbi:MAG TPA: c-type cytochrome [Candidatus Acidoferrum sp.]|nr:c-type cytochrome [Candidatus Acidoferrum sp.]
MRAMDWKTSGRQVRKLAAIFCVTACIAAASDGSWLKNVPDAERSRMNPFAGDAEAIAAGSRVFGDHCAKCHGDDATGRRKKPSLRSSRVQGASDGELFWLLSNGSLKRGMPTWSKLPEPTRWQVIAYVKSLGTSWLMNEEPAPERVAQKSASAYETNVHPTR